MLDHLKLTGVAHSTKFMDILQKFFERNDLVFTSVEHWTNKDGDEMIQLRWQKVKETNGTVERDVDYNKSETNGEKCANGEETSSESEDDPDCSRYLDDLYRRVSNDSIDFPKSNEKRRLSHDVVSRHEHLPTSHLGRWESAQKSPATPRKKSPGVTDRIRQRVTDQEKEKLQKINELEGLLSKCRECSTQGFCHLRRHKNMYLDILTYDIERVPREDACQCHICVRGSNKCACIFKELIRLVKKKEMYCSCILCAQPRDNCLREQLRLLRRSGNWDLDSHTTSAEEGTAIDNTSQYAIVSQYAVEVFSSLRGPTPLDWIVHFITDNV